MNPNLNIGSGSCPNLVQNVREPDHGQSSRHWMKRGSGPDWAGLRTTLSISDAADVVDSICSLNCHRTAPTSFRPSNSASSSDHTANPNDRNDNDHGHEQTRHADSPPFGAHRPHTDLSILAPRPPPTAPRQQISQPHRRTHPIPQHRRPSRPPRRATLVVARECSRIAVRAPQEPLARLHRKSGPIRARAAHSQGP